MDRDAAIARDYEHLTAAEVAALAAESAVKQTHLHSHLRTLSGRRRAGRGDEDVLEQPDCLRFRSSCDLSRSFLLRELLSKLQIDDV